MHLLLVGEGPADIGDPSSSPSSTPERERRLGAVGALVRRVLSDHFGREVKEWEIETDFLARVHELSAGSSGYERKVELTIVEAGMRNCSCVAVVVDRDRTPGHERLGHLRRGREAAERQSLPLARQTALGVAMETVEAWLLADEVALNTVLELDPPEPTLASPEQLSGPPGTAGHPKSRFTEIVARGRAQGTDPYEAVACCVRLQALCQRCPQGFAPFASELRGRCR